MLQEVSPDDATDALMGYTGGVLTNRACSETIANHAVLLVGYSAGDARNQRVLYCQKQLGNRVGATRFC